MEEKRDPVEATVEEEEVMEEEGEGVAEDIAAEEEEGVAEAMVVEAAVAVMEEAADMEAVRAEEEASNVIGVQYPWRRVRKSMSQLIRWVGEATESPASTTSSYSSQELTPATRSKYE